jgi:hypothetical protein
LFIKAILPEPILPGQGRIDRYNEQQRRKTMATLITFKTRAAGDVIMFGKVAGQLLTILGKDGDDHAGIITVAQLPDAIKRLEQAIAEDKSKGTQPDSESTERGIMEPVALWQRAAPLLEQFRYALREEQVVIWE